MAKYLTDAGAQVIANEIKKRYIKPTAGIPKSDLASSVFSSYYTKDEVDRMLSGLSRNSGTGAIRNEIY